MDLLDALLASHLGGKAGAVPSASSATPQALGTAAAGSSTDYSRADHVHAKPTPADIGAATAADMTLVKGVVIKDSDTAIDWSEAGSTTYALGWRSGTYNKTTGKQQSESKMLRTYKMLNFDGYASFTVTPPVLTAGANIYVGVAEYSSYVAPTASGDSFAAAFVGFSGFWVGDAAGVGTPVTVTVTEGHYYGFTLGYWTDGDASDYITSQVISQVVGVKHKTETMISQALGNAEDLVISQKKVTQELAKATPLINARAKNHGVFARNIALASGEEQSIDCKTFVRKNARLAFSGAVSSFDTLEVGFINRVWSDNSDYTDRNRFVVDDTNIYVYQLNPSSGEGELTNTIAHGLTLADYVQLLVEISGENTATITLTCNGQVFKTDPITFEIKLWCYPYVKATDCAISDGVLGWTSCDFDKDVWIFGDSYTRYVNTRWTYYLAESGYDKNCLINGHGGAKSTNEGWMSLNALLALGTPKYILWCFGMNDGGDSESAPSENWVTGRTKLLEACAAHGCTPVFATIPTVYDGTNIISHEQKNAWIRSSGYRYVDFAKSVGAGTDGNWRTGLRESATGLHPSALGAKVMFAQLLADFPEIMVGDDFSTWTGGSY